MIIFINGVKHQKDSECIRVLNMSFNFSSYS
jgi:hypothetical protein